MNMYSLGFLLLSQFLSYNQVPELHQGLLLNNQPNQTNTDDGEANIVVISTDGGQSWQDISEGLPKLLQDNYGIGSEGAVADNAGVYFASGNGIYHSKANSTPRYWTRESIAEERSSVAPGNNRIFAFNYWGGQIYQKRKGTNEWSPAFTNFKQTRIRGVFETAGGSIFISSDGGFFKSVDGGKSWKQLPEGGWGKIVESNGVLVATSQSGIVRSTDDGESWSVVISEGGVGIDVERIQGGFAAIDYSTAAKTRRIRTSYDDGQTWKAIDAGLLAPGFIETRHSVIPTALRAQSISDSVWHPANIPGTDNETYITSIIQVGEDFFCGHTNGIYKSSDKGKTWNRVLCAKQGKMYKLYVSGNVIYGVQVPNHC